MYQFGRTRGRNRIHCVHIDHKLCYLMVTNSLQPKIAEVERIKENETGEEEKKLSNEMQQKESQKSAHQRETELNKADEMRTTAVATL